MAEGDVRRVPNMKRLMFISIITVGLVASASWAIAGECLGYIALGDSVTFGAADDDYYQPGTDGFGFVGIMQRMRPDLVFRAAGHLGITLHKVLDDGIPEHLMVLWPDACGMMVLLGVNDSGSIADLGIFIDDLFRLKEVARRTKMPMWVATFPTAGTGPRIDLTLDMNESIRQVTSKRGVFRKGPDFGAFFFRYPWWLVDGIHPDTRGHVIMALMWLDTLPLPKGCKEETC